MTKVWSVELPDASVIRTVIVCAAACSKSSKLPFATTRLDPFRAKRPLALSISENDTASPPGSAPETLPMTVPAPLFSATTAEESVSP